MAPQALTFAAAYAASNALAAAGATVATQALVASAVATAVSIGAPIAISVGISYLASVLFRPPIPKPSDGSQEFQQPIPPRIFIYGRMLVAGPISFFERAPSSPRELFRHILVSAREIDAFEEYWLDEAEVTLDGAGLVTGGSFSSLVHLYAHLGTDAQTVDASTDAAFPEWTSAHRLRGVAYVCAVYNTGGNQADFQQAYSNGIPNFRGLIRGAKIYDPRLDSTVAGGSGAHRYATKSTWEWSDNAALVVLDYLTHVDGYNRGIDQVDVASFMAMADICDELVPLKAGGTEKRYRVAGAVSLAEPRTNVLKRLLEACDATLEPTAAGTWKIIGGEWTAPTVTLDSEQGHIIEAEFSGGVDALSRYNELAIQYLSPAHGYGEVEGDPWQNAVDIAATGIVETRPLDLLHVPSHAQARRLSKLRMARDNPEWVGTIKTNYYGLDAIGERCVQIRWPELGIDLAFWVEAIEVLGDGTGVAMRVRSASEDSYDWNAANEEGTAPPVPPDIAY